VYTHIDQTLVNSLHRLLNCEIGGLDCHVIIQQSIEHVSTVYTCYTYFVMHWSIQFIREYLVNVLIQCMYINVSTDEHYLKHKVKMHTYNGLRTYKCNMCSVFILYIAFK